AARFHSFRQAVRPAPHDSHCAGAPGAAGEPAAPYAPTPAHDPVPAPHPESGPELTSHPHAYPEGDPTP
ncbi:histidine kinase, partial [Streptomyces sp900105755]